MFLSVPHNTWSPKSWRQHPVRQQPIYHSAEDLSRICQQLVEADPIVSFQSINDLKKNLEKVYFENGFILHMGDCAERFLDANKAHVDAVTDQIIMMKDLIHLHTQKYVCAIGRIAGQYSKPRSNSFEAFNDLTAKIPVYRGESIHGIEPTRIARRPDPERLWLAYSKSRKTSELLNVNCAESHFPIFISHEGLHLRYEESFCRFDADSQMYYDLSAHFLWIGERTHDLKEGHIEFFRGIANPIGIKVGPDTDINDLARKCEILNPNREFGKLVIMTRLGAGYVRKYLNDYIKAVRSTKVPALWSCDPMHGNHALTQNRIKTRHFDAISYEFAETLKVHAEMGSELSGVHIETTPYCVTECLGGPTQLSEKDLALRYETYCDPRLNGMQTTAFIEKISGLLSRH